MRRTTALITAGLIAHAHPCHGDEAEPSRSSAMDKAIEAPATPMAQPSHKLADIRVRDPFIVADRSTGFYFLYAQCGNRLRDDTAGLGVEVYRSRDLVNWSGPDRVFDRPESGFWGGKEIWAPEVHRFGNHWFLFVTFNGREGGRGTQILRADAPDGPFRILADSATTPPAECSLDGTPWIDRDGTHWLVYCHEGADRRWCDARRAHEIRLD